MFASFLAIHRILHMRFSIRDCLLVTVVVGLCVAWWMDHRWQMAQRRALSYENHELQARYEGARKDRDECRELARKLGAWSHRIPQGD